MDHSGLETAGLDGMQDDDSHINISDVIEAIETTDPDFSTRSSTMLPGGTSGLVSASEMSLNAKRNAYVKIVEQPASKAMRFRYECEGRSAGSIPGASSTPENKTYPAIQVIGYKGRAVVVVSCVTKDQPYRSHPHNLVGKDGCKKGVCTVEVSTETMTVTFSNLGIRCVKKKDIEEALRIREEIRVDPFRQGFSHRNQPSSIDLNAVRLCFQVFLEGDSKGKFTLPLTPVVSEPIYDKKAMSDLVICKLSECTSSVAGGKEIILLCEKVAKEDIQVRFYEEQEGQVVWEALGDFQPSHVHKQVAISFRTPRYHTLEVNNPVRVNIQLLRPSDKACSEPWSFELLPLDSGRPAFWSLRRAFSKKGDYTAFSRILAADNRILTNTNAEALNLEPRTADKNEESSKDKQNIHYVETSVDESNTNDSIQIGGEWKNLNDVENREISISGNNKLNSEKKDWFDSDGKNQETNNNTEEKSLNELLNQVAELDEIYTDTQAKLLQINGDVDNNTVLNQTIQQPMEIDEFDENTTYSSLQMAFKNPVEFFDTPDKYEDVVTATGPFIDIQPLKRESDSEKLPPLPPKRAKKTETQILGGRPLSQNFTGSSTSVTLNTEQAQNILGGSNSNLVRKPVSRSQSFNVVRTKPPEYLAPQKNLPPTPDSTNTLPNPKKKGFFSKLFSRRNSKDKSISSSKDKNLDKSPNHGSLASFQSIKGNTNTGSISSTNYKGTVISDNPLIIHIPLKGSSENLSTNIAENTTINLALSENTSPPQSPDSFNPNLDLTDAEHYALYTAMAPHATQSEFDETSFYYSPVEGGKVLNEGEIQKRIEQASQ